MNMNEKANKYRLPNPSTPENLEMSWSKTLTFGDRVLVTGYHFNGASDKCYFAAVYEFLDEDHDLESMVGLREVSDDLFIDDGHAIAWAMQQ